MNGKFINDSEDLYIERPPFAFFPFIKHRLSDSEYLRLALSFSRNCGIKCEMNQSNDIYRIDFYMHKAYIMGENTLDWICLIKESDMHIMSVPEGIPQVIHASFYRDKQKNDSSL